MISAVPTFSARAPCSLATAPPRFALLCTDIVHLTEAAVLQDEGRYGVYASEAARQRAKRGWLGTVAGWAGWGRDAPIAVAAFPAAHALTAANLAQHPQQGAVLRELQELGLADERTAVMLHLAVERLRLRHAQQQGGQPSSGGGGGPSLLPWLALLPQDFGTTLYFSEPDMQWLRGTTLHKATRWVGSWCTLVAAPPLLRPHCRVWSASHHACTRPSTPFRCVPRRLRHKSLLEGWSRLRPAAQQLARQSGLAGEPSFEDWVWANSIFWSVCHPPLRACAVRWLSLVCGETS